MWDGVRPIIRLASAPTARMSPFRVFTATTDGSFSTMPRPRTYTSVFAVPRSMAMSRPSKPVKPSFLGLFLAAAFWSHPWRMGRFYSVNEYHGNLLTCVFAEKHGKIANPLVAVDRLSTAVKTTVVRPRLVLKALLEGHCCRS